MNTNSAGSRIARYTDSVIRFRWLIVSASLVTVAWVVPIEMCSADSCGSRSWTVRCDWVAVV